MSKKIGIFLMIVLVIWSLLLLDATKNRSPSRHVIRPAESTTVPVESISPETTAPAAAPTEPGDDSSRMEAILDRHTMNRTAVTHLVRTETAVDSLTADLAALASRREMNPIAAFWLLESEGLYKGGREQNGLPSVSLPEIPAQTAKQYAYTDAGAKQFLTELLDLAGGMESGMAQVLLGEDGAIDPGQVSLSKQDGCRYAYFAYTTDRSTRILCFYLRADAGGEWITDVEFQLLHMSRSTDPEQEDGQAAALAAAVELLMTGKVRTGGETAASYEVGGYQAKAERFFFTAEEEEGSLTNYRLRK